MGSTSPSPKGAAVTVVSSNQDTVRGLETYLRRAGIATTGTQALERVVEASSSSAVILFPDEYPPTEVRAALVALGRERRQVLVVIVTSDPKHFEGTWGSKAGGVKTRVIAKPAWAWTILDALRGRLDSDLPPNST